MNILYIAYSCNPYAGSEDKIGWNVPVESAKTNKVYVISKEEQREPVERYLKEHPIKNIKFFFVDIPAVYKKLFKGFMYSGRLNIWNRRVYPIAKKICEKKKIDIIHQITPIEFRAIGDYGKIPNVKFVCGPLGGGESVPDGLKDYAKGHEVVEIARSLINKWYRFRLIKSGKLEQCDYIMFANRETRDFLMKATKESLNVLNQPLSEIAIGEDEIISGTHPCGEKRIFLSAGRMIYRKGYEFLQDALSQLPKGLEYECRIVGGGDDLEKLRNRCKSNENLKAHVTFTGEIPYEDMENEYRKADVFIMPSIRETTGTVLLEAISKGLPVITINKFGGAILLSPDTGWLYEGRTKEEYIDGLKQAILECIEKPEEVERKGRNARNEAIKYTWTEKVNLYNEIYGKVVNA